MDDVVVFLGPSLSSAAASEIAPFAYRPPAAQGDIYRAVLEHVRVIGLIDGSFEGVPAVWHKEILFALSSGVHVFGAASMGALRAAELDAFGMCGVGRIYDWYADGVLEADDEVALVHAPSELGFGAITEPLVNVRATLEHAVHSGAIAADLAEPILASAKSLFYKLRTWPQVLARVDASPSSVDDFSKWLRHNRVDQKRLDAITLINVIVRLADHWPGPFRPGFEFEPTYAWNFGVEGFHHVADLSALDERVLDEARLAPDEFESLLQAAALTLLSPRSGARFPTKRGSTRRLDRFRVERGLQDKSRLASWLEANSLTDRELDISLEERESISELIAASYGRVLGALLTEIKLRGLYGSLAERARAKTEALANSVGQTDRIRPPARQLLEWFYETRLGEPIPDDIEGACRRLALPDHRALQELLAREYLFATLDR